MRLKMIAAAMSLVFAGSASAAPLIEATVTGSGGTTVWTTDASTGHYGLFLLQPPSGVINPTDNFTSAPTTTGPNSFVILGDGYPAGTQNNSDPSYTVTLNFGDGATISGQYVGSTFTGGTTATVGGTSYTLTGFGWDRSPADNVSPFTATKGGDPYDYTGQFAFTEAAAAVPESATWGMMILGMGLVGLALRRRKVATRVSFAA